MAVTTEIPWGDGSGDKIYLTRNASEGDQVVSVSSDANTGAARSKVVTFTSGVGNVQRQLTINQAAPSVPITKRLTASRYWRSSTTYVSVTNPDNMYTDIDSDTYATLTSTRRTTAAYYAYLNGFNLDEIPAGAHVLGIVIKIRGYQTSRISTASAYNPVLTNSVAGSVYPNTTASSIFGTSDTTIVIPTGSLTWEDIVADGANFSIRVSVTRASSNNQGYLYIYGAEIDVTYTI